MSQLMSMSKLMSIHGFASVLQVQRAIVLCVVVDVDVLCVKVGGVDVDVLQ